METFTGDLKQLFDLLKIICDGSVTDYYAYKTANSSVLTAYKINEEELENEMKLLTFCVLSMQSKDGTISYDVIAKALSITNDEVEYYVIDAVANDLVDAAIDQLNSLITVS